MFNSYFILNKYPTDCSTHPAKIHFLYVLLEEGVLTIVVHCYLSLYIVVVSGTYSAFVVMSDHKHGSNQSWKTGKRKRKFKRSNFPKSKRAKTANAAHKALSLVRKLNRAREVKYYDILHNQTTFAAAGFVYHMSSIAQGDSFSTRDGNSCQIFNLDLRWSVFREVTDTASAYRIILFRDTQQVAGVTPTVLSVLREANPRSQWAGANNRTRFQIYYDYMGHITTTNNMVNGHFNSRMQTKAEWYGAAAGDSAKNQIYMLVITDEIANFPIMNWTFRLLFNDF